MNPEQLIAHLKRLTASLSTQQLVTLAAVFVAVVGVFVGTAYWINTPTYAVLYSDLDAESAASVVSRLKTAKVEYVLDDGGRTVKVPSARLDELRLDMSSQGAPASGRIGFEIFDRTAFGTTEFLEHVNYRRALEGELARTISTIAEVSSARVHIAMAKDSLFMANAQSAKASVVLKLKGRKPLDVQTIAGITGLIASSVEDLRPESVVVMDTFGRSLTPRGDGASGPQTDMDGLSLDRQHRLERDLTTRVIALLEPIVGEGHVRVNVAARLDADSSEQTEERWDPNAPVLRSKQSLSDIGAVPAGSAVQPGAVSGARANTPAPIPAAGETASAAPVTQGRPPTRTSEQANYEVSRVTRHTVTPSGQVARLSVAVLLDDDRTTGPAGDDGKVPPPKSRTPEELDRLQKLVSAAVGIEQERGDQLTVVNVSFDDGEPVTAEPTPTMVERITTMLTSNTAIEAGRTLGILVMGLLAFTMFLKPMMNRALVPATAGGGATALPQLPATSGQVASLPTIGALEEQMNQGREDRKLTTLTRTASKMVDDEPENVARLVRTWISDNE